MGIFFEPYQADSCCLCGSRGVLTGEHKIKASALRKIFGKGETMSISDFNGDGIPREAQGPKSRAFHFSARMCSLCNGTRTQAADLEFDRFHILVSSAISENQDPAIVFTLPQYTSGSEAYLNVFRYFSKLLCCHIADLYGPRPLAACEFAIGKKNQNIISLRIDTDPNYAVFKDIFKEDKFASHGGLTVMCDGKTHNPESFQSSITLGEVRYTFWFRFEPVVENELHINHYEFWRKCVVAYQEALKNSSSNESFQNLGN